MLPPEPPPALMLPNVPLPVILNVVPLNVLAEITLALLMLPPEPPVVKFPTTALPVTFNVPAIFAPVPVTTNVVFPTAVRLILPLVLGIFTLLLPLASAPI